MINCISVRNSEIEINWKINSELILVTFPPFSGWHLLSFGGRPCTGISSNRLEPPLIIYLTVSLLIENWWKRKRKYKISISFLKAASKGVTLIWRFHVLTGFESFIKIFDFHFHLLVFLPLYYILSSSSIAYFLLLQAPSLLFSPFPCNVWATFSSSLSLPSKLTCQFGPCFDTVFQLKLNKRFSSALKCEQAFLSLLLFVLAISNPEKEN